MSVYLWGGIFLWIFRLLAFLIPKLDKVIYQYEAGSVWAPFAMGSIGALILETALLLIGRFELEWNSSDILLVLGLYMTGTLWGWLLLISMRYYDRESHRGSGDP